MSEQIIRLEKQPKAARSEVILAECYCHGTPSSNKSSNPCWRPKKQKKKSKIDDYKFEGCGRVIVGKNSNKKSKKNHASCRDAPLRPTERNCY